MNRTQVTIIVIIALVASIGIILLNQYESRRKEIRCIVSARVQLDRAFGLIVNAVKKSKDEKALWHAKIPELLINSDGSYFVEPDHKYLIERLKIFRLQSPKGCEYSIYSFSDNNSSELNAIGVGISKRIDGKVRIIKHIKSVRKDQIEILTSGEQLSD